MRFLLLQMEADYETYQTLTLSELEKAYHIKLECKRKTETDEYYVLVSERGGKAFIFTAHGLVSYIFFLRHALYSDELMGAVHLRERNVFLSACFERRSVFIWGKYGFKGLCGRGWISCGGLWTGNRTMGAWASAENAVLFC